MTDPTIPGAVLDDAEADPHWLTEHRERGARQVEERVPPRFADAVADHPVVAEWVRQLVDCVREENRTVPRLFRGPSLMLVGSTGVGKSYQAYGAIRALAVSGVGVSWLYTTAADLYAALRPRHGVDSETVFSRYLSADLLVLDDFGAAKTSEWNEEVNYRLINHRYEQFKPTLITSNVPPKDLRAALGERVASRLAEMATRVVLKGADRRITRGAA